MKGRAAVGHTPYVDSRTISLKDSTHVPGSECSDYDAVGRGELKVSPNLGKLRKKGWRKCRDYGSFKNPHNNIEELRFVANPEDPPCGRGVYDRSSIRGDQSGTRNALPSEPRPGAAACPGWHR